MLRRGTARSSREGRVAAGACCLAGILPVGALLAWSYGLGSFQSWFLLLGVPSTLVLIAIGVTVGKARAGSRLHVALVAGTIGGLAGTVGYDLFRVPFQAFGFRLMAPVDSYGVLLLGADSSNALTSLAGWAFHFLNGIGFGIAYATVALGRRWPWAVGWALVLETATVVTPFASVYGLRGRWGLIGIAYAAHVFYGYPLGRIAESVSPMGIAHAAPIALAAIAIGLLVWLRPFWTPDDVRAGRAEAPGPSAIIARGRFAPEWLRVRPGGCAVLRNTDDAPYSVEGTVIESGARARVCFTRAGVHRVKTSRAPYSGGFVIVDPALAR